MTVVAYKNGVLAADSVEIENGTVMPFVKAKVLKTENGVLIGAFGVSARAENWRQRVKKVIESWAHNQSPNWIEHVWITANIPQAGEDTGGVAFLSPHKFIYAEGETPPRLVQLSLPFCAWGSGADIALGAMRKGSDAVEAVEFACEFDRSCRPPITVVAFNK